MECRIAAAGWISALGTRQAPRDPGPIETIGGGPARRARIDPELTGAARWNALARAALADLDVQLEATTPLVLASCNGAGGPLDAASWERAFNCAALLANTPWADAALPVVSGSCVSALQALDHAQALLTASKEQVLLLAVDAVSAGNQQNFTALRILDRDPRPYQPANPGFVSGEAAAALLLRREGKGLILGRPGSSQDLIDLDGLVQALGAIDRGRVGAVIGQGTGPEAGDRAELASLSAALPRAVPLTTPALALGHTLGASSALSLGQLSQGSLPTLTFAEASDGRPLVGEPAAVPGVVVCARALGGSCAAIGTGSAAGAPPAPAWLAPSPPPALFHPGLQRLASEAPAHRPETPPDRIVLLLDVPCAPPPRAVVGGRVLPSAVLELTPATAARLLACAWGYTGPATCWVGGSDAEVERLLAAHRAQGERVAFVRVTDVNAEFRITWSTEEERA